MSTTNAEGEVVSQPQEYGLTVVAKFLQAFQNGYNITEACNYAGVARVTYYDWLDKHPEFADKVEEAKLMPNRRAKEVLAKAINDGDTNAAKYWLDRRDPDFKAKSEMVVSPGQQRTEEKLKEFMDDTDDGAYADTSPANDERVEPATEAEPESGNEVAPSTSDIS